MAKESRIRVRAKQPGVYGHLREEGAQFHLEDELHFSDNWMEHVDEKGVPVEDSSVRQDYLDRQQEKKDAAALATQALAQPVVIQPPRPKKRRQPDPDADPNEADDLGTEPFVRGAPRDGRGIVQSRPSSEKDPTQVRVDGPSLDPASGHAPDDPLLQDESGGGKKQRRTS